MGFAALLADRPDAWVGAIDRSARYVPIPEHVAVGDHRRLVGTWPLEHVVESDRPKLAAIWRNRTTSSGGANVHLVTGGTATYHVFDTTADHGVDLIVALPDADADLEAVARAGVDATTSRFCRILRDGAGRTLEIDAAAPKVLRYSAAELLAQTPPIERVHPDDHGTVLSNWMATLANASDGHRCRLRVIRGDGSMAWFELTNFNRLDDPARPHVVTEMLDISDEMAAHDALAESEQLLRGLAESLPVGVAHVTTTRRIAYANDRLAAILGVPVADTIDDQLRSVVAPGRSRVIVAVEAALVSGIDDHVEAHTFGGRVLQVTTKSLHGGGAVVCVADVTAATLMGRELERRATFDDLTRCLNRRTILARLDDALAAGNGGSAAIFVDLDGFKAVNDHCGHAVGDAVLRAAAAVLQRCLRDGDDVGRLGGDEFLVVCRDVDDPDEALAVANRIADALRTHPVVVGAKVPLRASIGVAWAARGTAVGSALVERADAAMYASKRAAAGEPMSA